MLSERMASGRQQQRLLNPHVILKEALTNPAKAKDGGTETLDGAAHNLLVIEDEVYPITLFLDSSTGAISKLSTKENDLLRRDTVLEILYKDWQPVAGSSLRFPMKATIVLGGQTLHEETRKGAAVNPPLDAAMFKFPEDANPVFNAATAEIGKKSSQYYQMFAAVGIPREGSQTTVDAAQLAPGVWHLTGGTHHSMVVEQEKGVVLAEAPLDETRSKAIIAWIKDKFPNKPITHTAVPTHHHVDHTGGLRTLVAEGATIIVHEKSKSFWTGVFQAESRILPDALALSKRSAKFETVPSGSSFTIPDALRPVTVYDVKSTHADDVVVIVAEGILFVSDLFSPGPTATAGVGGKELNDGIIKSGITVKTIAGGHGATSTIEEFNTKLKAASVANLSASLIQSEGPVVCPCEFELARSFIH
jgi:glyoxylase-like metal-dependent hydrolase (beta-lactamase superfamily II)